MSSKRGANYGDSEDDAGGKFPSKERVARRWLVAIVGIFKVKNVEILGLWHCVIGRAVVDGEGNGICGVANVGGPGRVAVTVITLVGILSFTGDWLPFSPPLCRRFFDGEGAFEGILWANFFASCEEGFEVAV